MSAFLKNGVKLCRRFENIPTPGICPAGTGRTLVPKLQLGNVPVPEAPASFCFQEQNNGKDTCPSHVKRPFLSPLRGLLYYFLLPGLHLAIYFLPFGPCCRAKRLFALHEKAAEGLIHL